MGRRFLILTAGYGEGHNSAARALREQAERRGDACHVHDLCREAMPLAFGWTRSAYLQIIGHWPWVWRALFDLADNIDTVGTPLPLRCIRKRLLALVASLRPDAIVCTFPLYALMLDEARERMRRQLPPYAVVITDSLAVSRSWVSSHPDLWLVTDERTRTRLLDTYGMAPERLGVSGFPVTDRFAPSFEGATWAEGEPFRVLYVPQGPLTTVKREIEAMTAASPSLCVTVVTGRKQHLFEQLKPYGSTFADSEGRRGRVSVLGWVDSMPQLMATHHLYVGKAGGASLHECYAACLPVAVNFFVPGQEEGNLELLLAEGCGCVCETPGELGRTLSRLLHAGGAGWKSLKTAMNTIRRRQGAERCWQLIDKAFFYDIPADR